MGEEKRKTTARRREFLFIKIFFIFVNRNLFLQIKSLNVNSDFLGFYLLNDIFNYDDCVSNFQFILDL